jgi:choline kinase
MSRFTRKIKQKFQDPLEVIILSAGIGARIKSYEPRSLIRIKKAESLIEHQISLLNENIPKCSITTVIGYSANKVIRRVQGKTKIVENQLYESSNNSESLRLALNNSSHDKIMFMHGDLYFDNSIFRYMNFSESFVLTSNMFADKEVGLMNINGYVSIFSYSLPTKWAQIAFLRDKELDLLKKIYLKDEDFKYNLTFEMLNKVIDAGGTFKVVDIQDSPIKEIDNIKDIMNESFN